MATPTTFEGDCGYCGGTVPCEYHDDDLTAKTLEEMIASKVDQDGFTSTTYDEGGYLTRDRGLIVESAQGRRFQVTITEVGR